MTEKKSLGLSIICLYQNDDTLSISTLGPSASHYHELNDGDGQCQHNGDGIGWTVAAPTVDVLSRLDLQIDNNRLLAEIGRLRALWSAANLEREGMEEEMERMRAIVAEKEAENEALRKRESALQKEGDSLRDKLKAMDRERE